MSSEISLNPESIFANEIIAWGKKYPADTKLIDVWKRDSSYLLWASGLQGNAPSSGLPATQRVLVEIAQLATTGDTKAAEKLYSEYVTWSALSQRGEGLSELPRPTRDECLEDIARSTIVAGHGDLDGIFSIAAAICHGKALSTLKADRSPFYNIRILRYGFRSLADYTLAISAQPSDRVIVIDYAAHPDAVLNLDHHMTSLTYWDIGTPVPRGVYEPTMPSCPRLLATFCGLEIPEDVLSGCDAIDGALYPSLKDAVDLDNPFVALEHSLGVEVSDTVAIKTALVLAEHKLDPGAVLRDPTWQARLALVRCELGEQRSYWSRAARFRLEHQYVAVADGRLAPYSSARFRYLPFENPNVCDKPYLITLRAGFDRRKVNLGLSRNPFYRDRSFFNKHLLNLGALAREISGGGGRLEASSCTVAAEDVEAAVRRVLVAVDDSLKTAEEKLHEQP